MVGEYKKLEGVDLIDKVIDMTRVLLEEHLVLIQQPILAFGMTCVHCMLPFQSLAHEATQLVVSRLTSKEAAARLVRATVRSRLR